MDNNELKECPNCGFNLDKNTSVCPYCGQIFDSRKASNKNDEDETYVTKTNYLNDKWTKEWETRARVTHTTMLVLTIIFFAIALLFFILFLTDKKVVYSSTFYGGYRSSLLEFKSEYIPLIVFLLTLSLIFLSMYCTTSPNRTINKKIIDGDLYLAYSGLVAKELVKNGQILNCKRETYYSGYGKNRHIDTIILKVKIENNKTLIVKFNRNNKTLFEVASNLKTIN